MLTLGLLALIALIWLCAGVTMIAVPSWWPGWISLKGREPLWRFSLAQLGILGGLILMLGTSDYRGYWLWASLGGLAVLKGLVILGAREGLYHWLIERWERFPSWAIRLTGVLYVGLAALLTLDALRSSS